MILKAIFNRAIRKVLSGYLSADNIALIKAATWEIHDATPEAADKGANLSIGFLLALARNNIAFYQALLQLNVPPQQAKVYLEHVNWEASKFLGRPLFLLSALFARGNQQRMVWSNEFLWKYLFRHPFARAKIAKADDSNSGQNIATEKADLAFNVTACPFQKYYRSQNMIEICEHAACKQDYKLAAAWDASFQRSKTLAKGDDCCDFRFSSNGAK